jgi:hypothetical protein
MGEHGQPETVTMQRWNPSHELPIEIVGGNGIKHELRMRLLD